MMRWADIIDLICMIQWETWLVGVNFMMYVMSVSMASSKETPRNEGRGFLPYHLNLLCRSIWELLLHIWSDFLKGGGASFEQPT